MSRPILPPPVWFLLCLAGAWAVSHPAAMEALSFRSPLAPLAGAALVGLGLVLGLVAVAQFFRKETTIHPMHPEEASALVTGGIFRLTRNPMYVALLLGLVGAVLIWQNAGAFVMPALFFVIITYTQILPEERALAEKFGEDYAAYRKRTPRWLFV